MSSDFLTPLIAILFIFHFVGIALDLMVELGLSLTPVDLKDKISLFKKKKKKKEGPLKQFGWKVHSANSDSSNSFLSFSFSDSLFNF